MTQNDIPVVTLRGISVSYGGRPILSDLNLSVEPGTRNVISGSNGAGKTTLLRIILGLIEPDRGDASVFGTPLGTRDWKRQRHRLAYLHQESVNVDLPISAYEVAEIGVVTLGLGYREKRRVVAKSMAMTGCEHLGERAYAVLSGGEKQKVSLARCMGQNPDILLLDEPCASLDPGAKKEIVSTLDNLNASRGTTMLMVSHEHAHIELEGWKRLHLVDGCIKMNGERG